MNASLALARIIGTIFIALYASFLINRKFIKEAAKNLSKNPLLPLETGFISMIIGLVILQFNNTLIFDFRFLITLIGWLFLVVGLFRIFFPKVILQLVPKLFSSKIFIIVPIVLLLIGIYLAYVGYISLL
jgi:hypothetical protein